jgi:hypothetical protein
MSDIKASLLMTAGGNVSHQDAVWLGRSRVKGIQFKASVAGTITLRDGGAAGPIICAFAIPAGADTIPIPGDGLLFRTDVFLVVTTATLDGLTVFYTA